jgi:Neuraminidase (sialidase)
VVLQAGASTVSAQDTVLTPTDPNTGERLRTGAGLPSVAIAATGQLYVVWEDARFTSSGVNHIVISTSTDGGSTWSAPATVDGNTPDNRPAFTPTVAVNSAGAVAVTYYDLRSLGTETATLPTDLWVSTSTDNGATWSKQHLTGPFDMKTAPNAGGFFLGDYQALGVIGTTFQPFFVAANTGNTSNRTDVFTGFF